MQLSILKSIKPKNYLKKEKKSRLKFIELCYRGEEKQGEKRGEETIESDTEGERKEKKQKEEKK